MNEWTKARTIFALMFYFTYVLLISLGSEVPTTLDNIVHILLGYYFGQRIKGGNNK